MDRDTRPEELFSMIGRDRNDIGRLINQVAKLAISNREFIAPIDFKIPRFYFSSIKTISTAEDLSNISKLHSKGLTVLSSIQISKKPHSFMLMLSPTPGSQSIADCPSLKDVETSFLNDRLAIVFHSVSGYNFSAEYSHIYMAHSSRATAFTDCLAVCKRAIIATDPSIETEMLERYVNFIVRVAKWESTLAIKNCGTAVATEAPSLQITAMQRFKGFHNVKVFIGNAADNTLSAWIRLEANVDKTTLEPTGPVP